MKRILPLNVALLAVAFVLQLSVLGCGAASTSIAQSTDDATITARVKTALLNSRDLSALKIDVSTNGGVVTISGAVKSKDEETRAVEIARGINGVKDVKSALRVEG
jgi:hyperosmotically inducible periplasmic protein